MSRKLYGSEQADYYGLLSIAATALFLISSPHRAEIAAWRPLMIATTIVCKGILRSNIKINAFKMIYVLKGLGTKEEEELQRKYLVAVFSTSVIVA